MKNIENVEFYFILWGDRAHEHSLGGVVGESGRWGGSWTSVALTSMQNLRLTKSTPYCLPAALTHSSNSVFTLSLFSQVQKISTYLFYLSPGLFIPLAYGYFPWMVKWSLFKRIIFITHVGMLEIRNGLGTGGTLHSHGIVFCVLQ